MLIIQMPYHPYPKAGRKKKTVPLERPITSMKRQENALGFVLDLSHLWEARLHPTG
jgi:hypothetical protein